MKIDSARIWTLDTEQFYVQTVQTIKDTPFDKKILNLLFQ